jgi:hypothetical protein
MDAWVSAVLITWRATLEASEAAALAVRLAIVAHLEAGLDVNAGKASSTTCVTPVEIRTACEKAF